ncbi:MAG: LLM class flavin-dependent oxidoreductase [Gammaproteobacteria bacterium]|nr:LLM class flavin-dependent oxidoreductase [Gammaproteobacteria bacterium]
MPTKIEFGMFDWVDRGPKSVAQLYESRLKLIESADTAGFYGYHLAEHHSTPLSMAPSPSVFFAALAQRTKHIRFSPMAYLLPMYHPLRLIEEVCMLDHLSNGRMELGISRGVSPYEIATYSVDPEETREIFTEVLEIFRRGMCEEVLNYTGKHFEFRDVPMTMKPFQKPYPPLWYPSFSESGVEFAAREGMHFMSLGPPSLITKLIARYREVAADIGNGGIDKMKLGAMRQIYVAETEEEAFAVAKPAYDDWYRSILELWHQKNDHAYDDFFAWEPCLAGETILIGSVDTVRDQIQRLVTESGINYFVGSFAWGSLSPEESHRSLDLFTSRIAPEIH